MRERHFGYEVPFTQEPVQAALRLGHKDPGKGFPTATDAFEISEIAEGPDGRKALHPSFEKFNGLSPDKRRRMHGVMIHYRLKDAFLVQHKKWRGTRQFHQRFPAPDDNRPWCVGDGERATRYLDGEFKTVPCPGRLCEFKEGEAPCKGLMELIFMPTWKGDDWPRVPILYASRGEHMITSILGMFDFVADNAHAMMPEMVKTREDRPGSGIDALRQADFPALGMPFTMTVSVKKSSKGGGRKFPVVRFSFEGDIMQWLGSLMQGLDDVRAGRETLLLPEQGVHQLSDDTLAATMRELEPGSIPTKVSDG